MPLEMNREVFITCAVTGSGATQDKSPHVPRSPKQIAEERDFGRQIWGGGGALPCARS